MDRQGNFRISRLYYGRVINIKKTTFTCLFKNKILSLPQIFNRL